MKEVKLLSVTTLLLLFISGCNMNDKWEQQEKDQIESYVASLGDTVYSLRPSGLYYIELKAGTGAIPAPGNIISFRYAGMFLNRYVFDSNYKVASPNRISIGTNSWMPGLDEGVQYMKRGGKARLLTPSRLAYGTYGAPPVISGFTPLIWEIELLTVIPGPEALQIQYYIESLGDTTYSLKTSGLYYIETLAGAGRTPVLNDTVRIKYKGMFLDRVLFDSNTSSTAPFKFVVGSDAVIPGLDEGVRYMKEGGKARLVIPSLLGYGTAGSYGKIGPNTPLLFEIEIISSKPGPGGK
jgi:FKBP-type peptidyl-prolyl cis-trans isomerase